MVDNTLHILFKVNTIVSQPRKKHVSCCYKQFCRLVVHDSAFLGILGDMTSKGVETTHHIRLLAEKLTSSRYSYRPSMLHVDIDFTKICLLCLFTIKFETVVPGPLKYLSCKNIRIHYSCI